MASSISAFWSLAGYVIGALVIAVPIGGLFLLSRTRQWQRRHAVRWPSEVPVWWNRVARDVPPELLYPPDTKRHRR